MKFTPFSGSILHSLSFKSSPFIIIMIVSAVIMLLQSCFFSGEVALENQVIQKGNNNLVGSSACMSCHSDIYNDFIKTSHKSSTMSPTKENIRGSFDEGKNSYLFNAYDGVLMKHLDSGLYQVNFYDSKFVKAYPFDMVIGSGTRGQSYAYWVNNQLLQLPISYYTNEDAWSNSPGYADGIANFGRVIRQQCLSCHSSNADLIKDVNHSNQGFEKSSIVYGINCERCHGPGGNHVDLFTQNPVFKGENLIVNAHNLSNQQELDACAVCHSSNASNPTTASAFATGDTLDHSQVQTNTVKKVDVHGNQYGLLLESKCFTNVKTMTCSTCHNPHQDQANELVMFSQKCMECHLPETDKFCKMSNKIEASVLKQNCIDCHMPNTESQILNVKLDTKETNTSAVIRSHLIKVYPAKSKDISALFMQTKLDSAMLPTN